MLRLVTRHLDNGLGKYFVSCGTFAMPFLQRSQTQRAHDFTLACNARTEYLDGFGQSAQILTWSFIALILIHALVALHALYTEESLVNSLLDGLCLLCAAKSRILFCSRSLGGSVWHLVWSWVRTGFELI